MKQILQDLRSGATLLEDVPCPGTKPGHVLIRTTHSLVSAGTERMLVEFGKANWIDKARQQPDKVRAVLDKIATDGLAPTVAAVLNKLNQPLPMGYSNAGIVIGVGPDVVGYKIGDRVASNGKHAEVVNVPVNLCALIPEQVSDEDAAFTVVAAIALQGIRLVAPTLGETVVVTGLGLIGLLTVQLLRLNGCRVLGLDFDPEKLAFARRFGAEVVNLGANQDPVDAALAFSRGRGVDAVIVTAATASSEPMHQAALMCRKRGRIVLVGVTGLELSRADFYEKELTFQVSCSYGPGRYDPDYEEKGKDYPFGLVRWTEQRNFEAVLDMMADGRLAPSPLVSHRFDLADAQQAYELVVGNAPSLGILLKYPTLEQQSNETLTKRSVQLHVESHAPASNVVTGFIGAGNYASAVLVPAFRNAQARLKTIASDSGVSGAQAARRFGFDETTTDTKGLLADPSINTVVITTRHDSHARFVCEALSQSKHVFVEKPLSIDEAGLDAIEAAYAAAAKQGAAPMLMVGFNRRFAPQVQKIKNLLTDSPVPKAFVMTVNAGAIPADHWTQDLSTGGGRIVGEACHFVDLLRFLAGNPIIAHSADAMASECGDTVTLNLRFADQSIGTIHYFSNGNKSFPKERLDVFCGGRVLQLDNFRKLTAFGWSGFRKMNLWRQDKGQTACAQAFVTAIATGAQAPIPYEELLEVSRVTLALAKQVQR
jgi:predicted dehydrogenase